ncbi:AI-2E family transporter [Parablautia muri]|uniref:AI-2E family transporter n=1 Tax=Parablautia muri TaxID=2320879 RepID=A0A9X5BCF1_9FIRM|nr:AI-2E family transporter [Parablautia muri]NBJ91087.1 AI-2E family transporter [Parablautia muri]
MKIKLTDGGKKYLTAAIVILFVYFAMKYISPIVSPFLLAFLLAGLLNPLIQSLHKKLKIRKSILAGLILFSICALIIISLWLIFSCLIANGSKIAGSIPEYQEDLCLLLNDCCSKVEQKFGVDSTQIENFIIEQMNVFVENLEVKILPTVMDKSVGCMKNIVSFISFIVIIIIAILLIMKDYDKYLLKFKENKDFQGIRDVGMKVLLYIKTFVKAQLIILCIISTICAVTLTFTGMKGGIFYGILTGFMDMLPFIGTGIMLIPLALFRLINGNYWQAVLCFFLYALCALIREFLEPKLIGDRVGVWPVGILFAVFAGIHLFGVWGIIKGPLSLVIVCETCKYFWDLTESTQQT